MEALFEDLMKKLMSNLKLLMNLAMAVQKQGKEREECLLKKKMAWSFWERRKIKEFSIFHFIFL